MGKGRGWDKGENYFSGFASLVFFLRGWGGVFSIRRRTSSGFRFGSSSLRGSLSVAINQSSENQKIPSLEVSREYVETLLDKISDVYSDTLGPSGYDCGLSVELSTEIITKVVLERLLKDGLTSAEKISKVLQHFPLHSEYPEQYNL